MINLENRKQVLKTTLRIIISVGTLIFLIYYIDFEEIKESFRKADLWLILIAFLMSFINIGLQILRWVFVCGRILEVESLKEKIITWFSGTTAGIITPMRLGEYLGRTLGFTNKRISHVIVATAGEKFFVFITLIFFGIISSTILAGRFFEIELSYVTPVIIILTAGYTIMWVRILLTDNKLTRMLKRQKQLAKILNNLHILKNFDLRTSLITLIISVAVYFTYITQFAVLLASVTKEFRYFDYFIGYSVSMFSKSVVPIISLGDLGIRESFAVFYFEMLNVDPADSFAASIMIFVINILIPALPGLVLIIKKK